MLKRRKQTTKVTKAQKVEIVCRECQVRTVKTYSDVLSVVCSFCVQKHVGMPETPSYLKPKSDKPRGWHLKSYFEHDGVVYSRGVEITDPDVIKQLKKESNKKTANTSKPRRKKNASSSKT